MSENIFNSEIASLIQSVADDEYTKFVRKSVAQAKIVCQDSNEKYHLEKWEKWDVSQDNRQLTLSNVNSSNCVFAEIQIVGSYSFETTSWKWAWDNHSIDTQLSSDSSNVRDFGYQNNFHDLITGQWNADEADGWLMSAITLHLCSGEGLYSGNFGSGRLYMLLKSISRSK